MTKNKTIYLPGLNGLRAIAALGVVISHIVLGLKDFGLNPYILGHDADNNPKGLDLAGFGVSIFFSLSGFLITYLLQTEKSIQKINVRKFYIRRILRIWPLYYLYIIFCLIFIFYYGLTFDNKSLLFYLFFTANVPFILHTTLPFLAHYWSLGVEEQFYLIWPWINRQVKNMINFVALLIILLILAKLLLHFLYAGSIWEEVIHIARFHCMMIGALGALLYKNSNILFIRLVDNKVVQLIAWLTILLLFVNRFHVASVIDNEIISTVTVFIIIGQINGRSRIVNLEKEVFDFLGKISYGIYVIHPLIIYLFSKLLGGHNIPVGIKYILVFVAVIFATIGLAYLSYEYFEKYFLRVKMKFADVKSSGTRHLPNQDISVEKNSFEPVVSY